MIEMIEISVQYSWFLLNPQPSIPRLGQVNMLAQTSPLDPAAELVISRNLTWSQLHCALLHEQFGKKKKKSNRYFFCFLFLIQMLIDHIVFTVISEALR